MKRASCYLRQGTIYMGAVHVTKAGFGITGEPYHAVSVNTASPNVIGDSLQEILDASREGVPDPTEKKQSFSGKLYKMAGVKGYKSFARGALLCSVYVDNENTIHFVPFRNLGQRGGFGVIADRELLLAHNSATSEIGATLLSAFERAE